MWPHSMQKSSASSGSKFPMLEPKYKTSFFPDHRIRNPESASSWLQPDGPAPAADSLQGSGCDLQRRDGNIDG